MTGLALGDDRFVHQFSEIFYFMRNDSIYRAQLEPGPGPGKQTTVGPITSQPTTEGSGNLWVCVQFIFIFLRMQRESLMTGGIQHSTLRSSHGGMEGL